MILKHKYSSIKNDATGVNGFQSFDYSNDISEDVLKKLEKNSYYYYKTGDEIVNEANNETGNEIDNETGNEIGDETGKEIDNETSNEIDNKTSDETSDEIDNETSNKTDNKTSDETSDEIDNEADNEPKFHGNNNTVDEQIYKSIHQFNEDIIEDVANSFENKIHKDIETHIFKNLIKNNYNNFNCNNKNDCNNKNEKPVSLNFYKFDDEKYCISLSQYAGIDYSGRDGNFLTKNVLFDESTDLYKTISFNELVKTVDEDNTITYSIENFLKTIDTDDLILLVSNILNIFFKINRLNYKIILLSDSNILTMNLFSLIFDLLPYKFKKDTFFSTYQSGCITETINNFFLIRTLHENKFDLYNQNKYIVFDIDNINLIPENSDEIEYLNKIILLLKQFPIIYNSLSNIDSVNLLTIDNYYFYLFFALINENFDFLITDIKNEIILNVEKITDLKINIDSLNNIVNKVRDKLLDTGYFSESVYEYKKHHIFNYTNTEELFNTLKWFTDNIKNQNNTISFSDIFNVTNFLIDDVSVMTNPFIEDILDIFLQKGETANYIIFILRYYFNAKKQLTENIFSIIEEHFDGFLKEDKVNIANKIFQLSIQQNIYSDLLIHIFNFASENYKIDFIKYHLENNNFIKIIEVIFIREDYFEYYEILVKYFENEKQYSDFIFKIHEKFKKIIIFSEVPVRLSIVKVYIELLVSENDEFVNFITEKFYNEILISENILIKDKELLYKRLKQFGVVSDKNIIQVNFKKIKDKLLPEDEIQKNIFFFPELNYDDKNNITSLMIELLRQPNINDLFIKKLVNYFPMEYIYDKLLVSMCQNNIELEIKLKVFYFSDIKLFEYFYKKYYKQHIARDFLKNTALNNLINLLKKTDEELYLLIPNKIYLKKIVYENLTFFQKLVLYFKKKALF